MTTPLVEAHGIYKTYAASGRERVQALRGVDLAVGEGEVLGLLGESGSGKSTLGRCLLRLERVDAGRVCYRGADITRLSGRALRPLRREMQVIFQDPGSSFDPRWTVESIVAEPLAVQGIFRRRAGRALRVAELLRQVGLPDAVMSRYPHEFSGGQRQRIAIARALATRPRFIVADEPFSALDVSVQAQLLNLLADLQQSQGLAYLLVSHDVSILLHLAHRVAVMYLGQIIEECSAERLALGARGGSPDQADVTASPTRRDPHPLHPYTEGLLTAMPTRDPADSGVAQPLAGDAPSPIAPPSGCAFHPRCPLYRDRRNSACVHRSPPLEDVAPGHRVACHELRRAKSLDSSSPPG